MFSFINDVAFAPFPILLSSPGAQNGFYHFYHSCCYLYNSKLKISITFSFMIKNQEENADISTSSRNIYIFNQQHLGELSFSYRLSHPRTHVYLHLDSEETTFSSPKTSIR